MKDVVNGPDYSDNGTRVHWDSIGGDSMDYVDLVEEMQRYDEAEIWWAPDSKDYEWEFYALDKGDEFGEWIGRGDDPIEAYKDREKIEI